MILRMSFDISLNQRISISIWPNKKAEERTWKLFDEQVLRKVRETGARVEISKGTIKEIIISETLDLKNF